MLQGLKLYITCLSYVKFNLFVLIIWGVSILYSVSNLNEIIFKPHWSDIILWLKFLDDEGSKYLRRGQFKAKYSKIHTNLDEKDEMMVSNRPPAAKIS